MENLRDFKGNVRFTGIVINLELMTFSLVLFVKDVDKSRYREVGEFGGRISGGVYNFFTRIGKSHTKTEDSDGQPVYTFIGEETKFKRYARLSGQAIDSGKNFSKQLSAMKMDSLNHSEIYNDCPLKLVIDKSSNKHMLKTVKEMPKWIFKDEDPFTSKVVKTYADRTYTDSNGIVRPEVYPTTEYCRIRLFRSEVLEPVVG